MLYCTVSGMMLACCRTAATISFGLHGASGFCVRTYHFCDYIIFCQSGLLEPYIRLQLVPCDCQPTERVETLTEMIERYLAVPSMQTDSDCDCEVMIRIRQCTSIEDRFVVLDEPNSRIGQSFGPYSTRRVSETMIPRVL